MSWAQRRKILYIGGILLFFVLVVGIPTYINFYKAPTCFDNKQNQDEQGIDCGGSCDLLCPAQYVPLNLLWKQKAIISDGIYNVMAYIENPNFNARVDNLSYVFRLYDKDNILLRERYGKTIAPANKIMAIFEPEMYTGNQIPKRVEFYILPPTIFVKQDITENNLSISQAVVTQVDTAPRLSALLTNKSTKQINNIEAIGIIYNADGNAIAFSRTIVESIGDKGSLEINFNWPKPFSDTYTKTEIVLKVLSPSGGSAQGVK